MFCKKPNFMHNIFLLFLTFFTVKQTVIDQTLQRDNIINCCTFIQTLAANLGRSFEFLTDQLWFFHYESFFRWSCDVTSSSTCIIQTDDRMSTVVFPLPDSPTREKALINEELHSLQQLNFLLPSPKEISKSLISTNFSVISFLPILSWGVSFWANSWRFWLLLFMNCWHLDNHVP